MSASDPSGRRPEGAETIGPGNRAQPAKTGKRRTLNEAAHKLSNWSVSPAPRPPRTTDGSPLDTPDPERDVVANASRTVLALGALGVVYGDIGTSPLYAEQVIFNAHRDAAHTTIPGVY